MSGQTLSSAETISVTLPTGQEIYDMLMKDIDQDLVSANIPTLEAKYAGETKEQNAERLVRYQKAYEKYDQKFDAWMHQFNQLVDQYRKEALKMQEGFALKEDAAQLSAIEQQFASQK